jgi:hypothetical protein
VECERLKELRIPSPVCGRHTSYQTLAPYPLSGPPSDPRTTSPVAAQAPRFLFELPSDDPINVIATPVGFLTVKETGTPFPHDHLVHCSAVVISKEYVLTEARCADWLDPPTGRPPRFAELYLGRNGWYARPEDGLVNILYGGSPNAVFRNDSRWPVEVESPFAVLRVLG